jgi:hypothetical protein
MDTPEIARIHSTLALSTCKHSITDIVHISNIFSITSHLHVSLEFTRQLLLHVIVYKDDGYHAHPIFTYQNDILTCIHVPTHTGSVSFLSVAIADSIAI